MNAEQSPDARRTQAINQWLDAVFAMYPLENTGFMRTREDRFANPVGHALRQAAEALYDAVTGADTEREAINAALAAMVRVRAVQDLRPDQAVGALFLLKPILRELFLVDALAAGDFRGYLDMESRVDTLALMAFNLYVADREAVYAERVAEQRRSTAQLRRWAERHGLVAPVGPTSASSPDCSSGAPLHARSPERGVPAHSRRLPRRAGAAAGDGFLGGIRNPGTR